MDLMIRKYINWFKLDNAIRYGLLTILFQVLSTPITIIFIVYFLTEVEQGFYYTFISVLSIDSLLSLGLFVYLLNFASREWSVLKMDSKRVVHGKLKNRVRLANLIRWTVKFYALMTMLHFVVVGFCGYLYLDYASDNNYELQWVGSWFALAFISGLLFFLMPFTSILEGCGQINEVEKFRFFGLLISNVFLWIGIFLNFGLWSLVLSWSIRVLRDLYFLIFKYRMFFVSLFEIKSNKYKINWKKDILPTQWKLGLSGLFSYFLFHSINPIVFNFRGAEDAGKIGMSLQISEFLRQLCNKWVGAKRPKMGKLLARKKFKHLELLYKRVLYICVLISVVGAAGILILVWGLSFFEFNVSNRIVDLLSFGLILLAVIAITIEANQVNYLRIFLVEKVVSLSIVTSIIMGLMVALLTKYYGILGASFAYFFVMVCVSLPWLTYIKFKFKADRNLL